MRMVAQEWVSVDGCAAGPDGEDAIFAVLSPEADAASQRWNHHLLGDVEEVLLGRRTYEAFARYWPGSEEPIAAALNAAPKVVFSRSLGAAPWGPDGEGGYGEVRIERDAVAYVAERRAHSSGSSLLWGSLTVLGELWEAGEIDELDLFVAPVVLGAGTPLLPRGTGRPLAQLDVEVLPGALHVRYDAV